jgi:hypothetical protein
MKKLLLTLTLFLLAQTEIKAQNVPLWTSAIIYNTSARDVCIEEGPTNLRLNPSFGNNIRAQVNTNSCGEVLLYENNFVLYEAYFPAVNETRSYWVHESQIRDTYPWDYREYYQSSSYYWDYNVERCRSRSSGRFVRSSLCD